MAKFSSKLSKQEQEDLLSNFCLAISQVENVNEAATFLKDLLSVQEAEMLAKRLKIAELLIKGRTYTEISFQSKVSPCTIARVHQWLRLSGDGYRLIIERINKESKGGGGNNSWRDIKKKYPLYFWPQIVLENVVKMAKEKERQKLRFVIKRMDQKSELFKQLDSMLGEGKKRVP